MDFSIKERHIIRRQFSRIHNEVIASLGEEVLDVTHLISQCQMLEETHGELIFLDKNIFQQMLESSDYDDKALDDELVTCDSYKLKFHTVKNKIKKLTESKPSEVQNVGNLEKKKYRLPKIEFKKFSGEITEWLHFWSQFNKVHTDPEIPPEDKFQYLIQSVEKGSRAYEVVTSFPPTSDNYNKVIESLKARFGNEDLQVEVYIRELLKLVLNKVVNPTEKPVLCRLYDKLESHLRALESLGVTTEKCNAMLYPLIESSLPEEVLRAWQRNTSIKKNSVYKNRLSQLMAFLQEEVVNEQRISLAMKGFDVSLDEVNKPKKDKKLSEKVDNKIPTASSLLVADPSVKKNSCIFCNKSHVSSECFKAQNMTLEERKNILTRNRSCFNCLKKGHRSRECRALLKCISCGGKHVVLMCDKLNNNNKADNKNNNASTENNNQINANLSNIACVPEVYLQTLVVSLRGNNVVKSVRAIIDTGSTKSYIREDLAKFLKYLPIKKEKIIHSLFGGINSKEEIHNCYKIVVGKLNGNYIKELEVLSQGTICNDIPYIKQGAWTKEIEELGIQVTDLKDRGPIQLLIGADIAGEILTGKRYKLKCGLVAVETLLGWTIMGKVSSGIERKNAATLLVTSLFSQPETRITDLWNLDVLGITDPVEKLSQLEQEQKVKQYFLETTEIIENGRYEVRLPWRESHPPLPTHKEIALRRLQSTSRKLRDENRFEAYGLVFQKWLEEGIIEKVPEEEIDGSAVYLPHRPVYKDNSTTKIRPVFDASARQGSSPSLNCCLEKGPNMIELIPHSLLRFRENKIGVIADIEKAFLQISIHPSERDFLRFLWWEKDESNIITFRHKRVVFGLSCSPYLLSATIAFHLNKRIEEYGDSEIYRKLKEGFYVDNCVTSVDSLEELTWFEKEASSIMREGCFNLRGWEYSNDHSPINEAMVLGLVWEKEEDCLRLHLPDFKNLNKDMVTKRTIITAAHQVFDPMGFACPVLLHPKILLQELWSTKVSWDDEVNELTKKRFQEWVATIPVLNNIKISRALIREKSNVLGKSLHLFCDASKIAYAAVVYLRIETTDGVEVKFMQAKARVAPKKNITIPRLELLAATIGARLANSVKTGLKWDDIDIYCWSDSMTVLSWINREESWGVFVSNRVKEIRKLSEMQNWRHVPGSMNPADLASRGCKASQLVEEKWWEGPEWLALPPSQWPNSLGLIDEEEVRRERKKGAAAMVNVSYQNNIEKWHLNHFSGYRKTFRMLSWVLRFVDNCRRKTRTQRMGSLSSAEVEEGERLAIRLVQEDSFQRGKNKQFNNICSFKDEKDIIRLKTKIIAREDAYGFRYPIVLPARHPVVESLVWGKHVEMQHAGTHILLNALRETYWILGGRKTIRRVLSKCNICRRYNSQHLDADSPYLPVDRVKDGAVFECVGVDFAGPLILKDGQKAWICLFTCAIFRAVHFELVTSLSTAAFLEAFRRFVARRGRPSVVYSDNGTNFHGTQNSLEAIKWEEITEYASIQRINWKFNPPTAAWWGGWWERIVRILKQLLRKVLGRSSITYQEMSTVLCDAEAVINSRPLTYLTENSTDLVPITPAMFLQEIREVGVPDIDFIENTDFNRKWKYRQKIKEELRLRFRKEYLGQLIPTKRKVSEYEIKVGDVMLIENENSKRLDWPLGRVKEIIEGKGGKIRVARLTTKAGEVLRPIQRLYPLEATSPEENFFRENKLVAKASPEDSTLAEEGPEDTAFPDKSVVKTRSGRVVRKPKKYV